MNNEFAIARQIVEMQANEYNRQWMDQQNIDQQLLATVLQVDAMIRQTMNG
jgi:ABC-type cobalamin/Fe3+-siderophores transport system ATPase subunit